MGAGAHGTTFGGNPLVCAAAAATLEILEDGLVENAARQGRELLDGLQALVDRHARTVVDVRGRGLMIGVEFPSADASGRVRDALLARQVIVSTAGPGSEVIRLAPPLLIEDEHVARFLEAFRGALGD